LARTGTREEPGALEALEVHAHAVGVKAETLRELDRAGRAPQLAQQLEQACPGRLAERVLTRSRERKIDHDPEFCTVALGKSMGEWYAFSHWRCNKERRKDAPMTYVINEPCIATKDSSCVEVCPVDCIHPTPDEPGFEEAEQLYIDPEECIDCDACVEACPVDAITPEDQVPPEWQSYVEKNAAYYRHARR
jgi:NAD-dependent dihydropyrimidine dehydrogenase PreA subunit